MSIFVWWCMFCVCFHFEKYCPLSELDRQPYIYCIWSNLHQVVIFPSLLNPYILHQFFAGFWFVLSQSVFFLQLSLLGQWSFLSSCFFAALSYCWIGGLELLWVNINLTFPSFRAFFLFWKIKPFLSFDFAFSNLLVIKSWGYFLSSNFFLRLSRWKSLSSTEEHLSTTLSAWLYGILDLQWVGWLESKYK